MPQRLADVALEPRSKLLPGGRQIEDEILQRRPPLERAAAAQRVGEFIAHSRPVDPVPIADLRQVVAHRPYREMFIAALHEGRSNLCNGGIGAEQVDGCYFERPDPAAADDERQNRHAAALGIAQYVKMRLVADVRAAVDEVAAPAQMPLIQAKGQRVAGYPQQTLEIRLQGADPRQRGHGLERDLRERERAVRCHISSQWKPPAMRTAPGIERAVPRPRIEGKIFRRRYQHPSESCKFRRSARDRRSRRRYLLGNAQRRPAAQPAVLRPETDASKAPISSGRSSGCTASSPRAAFASGLTVWLSQEWFSPDGIPGNRHSLLSGAPPPRWASSGGSCAKRRAATATG